MSERVNNSSDARESAEILPTHRCTTVRVHTFARHIRRVRVSVGEGKRLAKFSRRERNEWKTMCPLIRNVVYINILRITEYSRILARVRLAVVVIVVNVSTVDMTLLTYVGMFGHIPEWNEWIFAMCSTHKSIYNVNKRKIACESLAQCVRVATTDIVWMDICEIVVEYWPLLSYENTHFFGSVAYTINYIMKQMSNLLSKAAHTNHRPQSQCGKHNNRSPTRRTRLSAIYFGRIRKMTSWFIFPFQLNVFFLYIYLLLALRHRNYIWWCNLEWVHFQYSLVWIFSFFVWYPNMMQQHWLMKKDFCLFLFLDKFG